MKNVIDHFDVGTNRLYAAHASDAPKFTPGECFVDTDGREYRYVKNQATDSMTAGYPAVYMDADPHDNEWEVTCDLSDGILNALAGVAMTTVGAAEYGWVLRNGAYETSTVIGTVTAAGGAVRVGDTDGQWAAAGANDIERIDGVCMEVVSTSGTGVTVYVDAL